MPTRTNRFLVATGIFTLVQAAFQTIYAGFALAQYFCVVDFLHHFQLLIFIRILYFHNPQSCGARINVGESIDGVANQAFVLIQRQPFTTDRTFIINCISLGLGILWVIGSILLIKGGTRKHFSNHTHWPWLMTLLAVSLLDIAAAIMYANDSFHTQTLDRIMQYINGTASGLGNMEVDTYLAAWLMVLIYSKFVLLLLINGLLMIFAIVDCTRYRSSVTSSELERNQDSLEVNSASVKESDQCTTSSPSDEVTRIPRPGLNQTFRAMKSFLFNRTFSNQPGSTRTSINGWRNRHRAVSFPEEVELPPTLENMILEQRRRLDMSMVDTAGRRSPAQASRLTHAHSFNNLPETSRGRRGTAVELQGQMPWSYIPASANRMRDQLPPDEDLPPVPLPDYSAIQSARKASVHRAASSLSSMTQKKEYLPSRLPHQATPGESAPTAVNKQDEVQPFALEEATGPAHADPSFILRVPIDAFDEASLSDTWQPIYEPVLPILRSLPRTQPPRTPAPRALRPRTPSPSPQPDFEFLFYIFTFLNQQPIRIRIIVVFFFLIVVMVVFGLLVFLLNVESG